MAAKIRKGDRVVVLTGKDGGKSARRAAGLPEGKPCTCARREHGAKRHQKQSAETEGGIVSKEMPLHLSNLALEDPKDGKPTRVGFKTLEDGRKVRYAKRSGEVIDD